MASMQITGGVGAAASGKAGNNGALDPLLMGLSPEPATSVGSAGEGSGEENPFSSELAAALASLDAEQAATLAENLLDDAFQDGQIIDPTAVSGISGQNLPIDPVFQNAILASFAALTGAVAGQPSGDGDTSGAALLVSADTQVMVPTAASEGVAADVGLGPAAVGSEGLANSGLIGSTAAGGVSATNNSTAVAQTAVMAVSASLADPGSSANASVTQAVTASPVSAQQAGSQTPQMGQTSAGDVAPGLIGVNTSATRLPNDSGAQGQPQSGSSSQDQALAAAALAEAARLRGEKEAGEYSGKQTSLAGSLISDVGNVVVTAKPNAEGVAAAADAARQSAQRVESSLNSSTPSIAQSSSEALARAESKLEAARASLGTGPLNVEILKLTRQGGGRAVLEVTPPNQGPIRIDLQLDGTGRASLVVEGLSDSMKARLESSAHFLRQDMAQMGLALNLEMRERNDSGAAAQAFAQGQFGQSGQGGANDSAGSSRAVNAPATGRADGNGSSAQRSTAVDDGLHLVA
ncbi:MAG: flagellar hook-length control protein FliK [Betaproteobacteria bacterium]